MAKMRHVIIGNSAAGLSAARAIRSCDARCSISILSAEDCLAYSPAVLPYLLSGRTSEKQIYITDNAFYQENSLDLHLNKKVVGIDIKGQKVFVHDGSSLGYDRLLIATGGSPRKLVVGDQPREKLFTLRTMSDAERILNASGSAKNIVLVGAGLVGLETSHALHKRGKNIRILAKSNQVLSRNADRQCSRIMQNRIEKEGISFLFGRDVIEIVPMKTKLLVVTDQGDNLDADLMIIGKGVTPNINVVDGTGIKTDKGILVNFKMQTTIPNVFAAGDVAQARNLFSGKYEIFANWPSACIEGKIAGLNMAGKETKLAGEMSYNIVPVFDQVAAFGEKKEADHPEIEAVKYVNEKRGIYRKILIRKNRIVGVVSLGRYKDAGVIINLMKKRVDISSIRQTLAKDSISWGKILKH